MDIVDIVGIIQGGFENKKVFQIKERPTRYNTKDTFSEIEGIRERGVDK